MTTDIVIMSSKNEAKKNHCSAAALFIVILQMATDDFAGIHSPPELMHIACVALIFLFFHVFLLFFLLRVNVCLCRKASTAFTNKKKKSTKKKRNTFWKHQIVKSSRRIDGKYQIISSQSSVSRWHIHSHSHRGTHTMHIQRYSRNFSLLSPDQCLSISFYAIPCSPPLLMYRLIRAFAQPGDCHCCFNQI